MRPYLDRVIISEITGLVGLVFGLVGTIIGVSNYFRDRAKLVVVLNWDIAITEGNPDKRFGCITITNTGRRAIYISHVALCLPKGSEFSHFLIQGGLKGQKLSEGDPPAVFRIEQDGLEDYVDCWNQIIGQVGDSTGRVWLSKKVRKIPSWANAGK